MQISFHFSALKRTKWHDYAVRFLFGGLVTVFAGLLAKHFGPVFGGLFLAFPAIFPASATLVENTNGKRNDAQEFCRRNAASRLPHWTPSAQRKAALRLRASRSSFGMDFHMLLRRSQWLSPWSRGQVWR
jgi:hypothetical protein